MNAPLSDLLVLRAGGEVLSLVLVAAAVPGVSTWSASRRRLAEMRDAGLALQKTQPGAGRPAELRLLVGWFKAVAALERQVLPRPLLFYYCLA
jgi:hypothetical protein